MLRSFCTGPAGQINIYTFQNSRRGRDLVASRAREVSPRLGMALFVSAWFGYLLTRYQP